VLDARRSGLVSVASLTERVLLPRIQDAIDDHLDLLAMCEPDEETEFFILDFSDAFWQLPNKVSERKYFVCRINDDYFVFLRTAQGTKNAPLTWNRMAALISRLTQSLFWADEVRIRCYVDDPNVSMKGTSSQRDLFCAICISVWAALGFTLAFPKGERGSTVDWIGVRLQCTSEYVRVSLKASYLEELKGLLLELLKSNLVSLKTLRSVAGKPNRVATIVYTWRPFLSEFWGAISECIRPTKSTKAPQNFVWLKQILPAVDWMLSFLEGREGSLIRTYSLPTYMGLGNVVTITTDASPWGLGGILCINGQVAACFSSPIIDIDEKTFGHKIGDAAGQQTWEALSQLVALREWKSYWMELQIQLGVRSDSIGTLTLLRTLKATGSGPNLIAREIALEFGDASFRPSFYAHLPGIVNKAADYLSRIHQPGFKEACPPYLASLTPQIPPVRHPDWYRTSRRWQCSKEGSSLQPDLVSV